MISVLASVERQDPLPPETMTPQEILAIGKEAGVPVFIDVASELPPTGNLTKYTEMGADLVAISGGKGIQGPQSSGILVGRGDLIDAATLNAFPNSHLGRGMKVGKEEIVGMIAALNRGTAAPEAPAPPSDPLADLTRAFQERSRSGVSEVLWTPDGGALLFVFEGHIYRVSAEGGAAVPSRRPKRLEPLSPIQPTGASSPGSRTAICGSGGAVKPSPFAPRASDCLRSVSFRERDTTGPTGESAAIDGPRTAAPSRSRSTISGT